MATAATVNSSAAKAWAARLLPMPLSSKTKSGNTCISISKPMSRKTDTSLERTAASGFRLAAQNVNHFACGFFR